MSELVQKPDLHEAMILVLQETKLEPGVPELPTTQLAAVIRGHKLYVMGKGGSAAASQMGSRARRFPALFKRVLVQGKSHISQKELPRLSQLVAKVMASTS